uniref:Uncharacterized protein n=1 Tax=Sphaerodactylus townsendi TaxID=933632 RepID=A0ACB8FU12_9SAUR
MQRAVWTKVRFLAQLESLFINLGEVEEREQAESEPAGDDDTTPLPEQIHSNEFRISKGPMASYVHVELNKGQGVSRVSPIVADVAHGVIVRFGHGHLP